MRQTDRNNVFRTDHQICPRDIQIVSLKKREVEILQLLFYGLTNREIGDRMCLSPYTIRNYISVLLFKFEARNRTELLARFTALRRRYHRRLVSVQSPVKQMQVIEPAMVETFPTGEPYRPRPGNSGDDALAVDN